MTKKQLIDSFEQVDEFCIQVEDLKRDDYGFDEKEQKVGRYEWICTTDMSEFHACEAGWKTLSWTKYDDGYFEGTVLNQCEECGEKFESTYTEACDNPEIINKKNFESGKW